LSWYRALVFNSDLKVLGRIDLYEAIVDNRVEALNDWSHKIAHDLEADRCTVFNFDVEVGHALSSLM